MRKHPIRFAVGLFVLFGMAVGCTSDYNGRTGEMTEGQAKLWGKEAGFSGFPGNLDGTWSQTVKYNNKNSQGAVTIYHYRNPVFSSFSRDGLVNRDGDDVHGRLGDAGGKFGNGMVYIDNTPNSSPADCEFVNNQAKNFSNTTPQVHVCYFGTLEENDKDLALQDAFSSLDNLFKGIWGGTVASVFGLDLTSVTLNGTQINLTSPVGISVGHNGFRPVNWSIDGTQPGLRELYDAILANTNHMEATDVAIGFSGGMNAALPVSMVMAFDHDAMSQ